MSSFATVDLKRGEIPLLAAAVHDGHRVRHELQGIMAIGELERLREEDPFTGLWTSAAEAKIIGQFSRFEVDLNRPRQKAIYLEPEDAWGLKVWKTRPSQAMLDRSLEQYDEFYKEVGRGLEGFRSRYRRFVVFDLHTYNHRREGPEGALAESALNPEVNIGTGTMDRTLWAPIVDRFVGDLGAFDFLGRHLDVRENIKFQGGQFSRWIHENFADSACSLAIEFKKFFMDEWTGEPDEVQLKAIGQALKSTIPGVLEELKKLG